MRASLLVVAGTLAGCLAGAAGTYLVLHSNGASSSRTVGSDGPPEASSLDGIPATGRDTQNIEVAPISTSDRLALYAFAAEQADPDALEPLIERAAALPPSHRRSFELDALLTRLAESDPARAVRYARALRLETQLLVPLFQSWAKPDARAALSELRSLENAAAVREIALALLDVFGNDEAGIARLESVLSEAQMRAFRVDAAVRLADRDPLAALQRALSLQDALSRSTAISRLASEFARTDPEAALAQVGAIPDDELRMAYQNAVLNEWGRIDPESVLAYLRSEGARGLPMNIGLPAINSVASADPDGLLAVADQLPFQLRTFARRLALQALAEQDPTTAIQIFESIPNVGERSQLAQAIAGAYARRDPEGALAWAMSLGPEAMSAVSSVLGAIAAVDPERAIDLALRDDMQGNTRSPLLMMNVVSGLRNNSDLAALADRLVARGRPDTTSQLSILLSAWSSRDPQGALDWFIANAESADPGVVGQMAAQLAASDPLAAARAIDRLPAELRGNWLAQVAAGYADYDSEAAVAWVMQYQGQPGFDQAVVTVAQRTAMNDPQAAIRLIERIGRPLDPPIAVQIAASWASREPAAAADWALRLPDEARSAAVGVVASNWSVRDPEGAKRWALNLPSGALRDGALEAIVPTVAVGSGAVDGELMDAFSNRAARQQAVLRIVGTLAARNRQEAERLVDTYVTDPAIRQQAEQMMDQIGSSMSSGFFIPAVPSGALPAGAVRAPINAIRVF